MKKIELRKASWFDRYDLWRWRNQPFVRHASRNTDFISLANHLTWFEKNISTSNSELFIASVDNVSIGVLRFDYEKNSSLAEVSIYLRKSSIGRGLGTALLTAGIVWIKNNKNDVEKIIAVVHPKNFASQRAFLRAGFLKKATTYEFTI